ncbi:ROK family protein [Agromyces mangrovi Wang et al. 2018]|uniref:ROK family protein n=1 Tax=Agromyces mangrovi TaxID=1858653 RepID=UPI002573E4F9|nr:ROK family protein [Agromyces mangrovi]BDZ65197.1 glucokinase [Agromyces mangrovi]
MSAPSSTTTLLGDGPAVLAFDVGGTHVKSALVDTRGRMLGVRRHPTVRDASAPGRSVVAQLGYLAEALRDAHRDVRPLVAGVSVPGIVDERTHRAIYSSNLGWRNEPLYDLVRSSLRLPVAFGHDVRGAGQAELRLGAARSRRDVVIVTIGTGISATLIVDGRVRARGGYAGEIGHMLSDAAGAECACGSRGCLETIASASAIARRYFERTGEAVAGAREVRDRMAAGDPHAARIWDDAVDALAVQLQRLSVVLAPELIVVGGGLAAAGDALIVPLRRRLDALMASERRPRVVRTALGDDAGLVGAALAARDLATGAAAGMSA